MQLTKCIYELNIGLPNQFFTDAIYNIFLLNLKEV